jgi:hypothetical protein
MNLYIQIKDGQPINHPSLEENLLQAFGAVPEDWKPFVRIELKDSGVIVGVYQKPVCVYTSQDGNTWQDTWSAVDMIEDEKQERYLLLVEIQKNTIDSIKSSAQNIISSLTNENDINCWNTYLSLLNAIIITDPTQVYVPALPKKDNGVYKDRYVDGVWITRHLPINI